MSYSWVDEFPSMWELILFYGGSEEGFEWFKKNSFEDESATEEDYLQALKEEK